jgi:uncharacterized membrane protein
VIKYNCSFAWGCRELTFAERIRKTFKKTVTSLAYMIVLLLLVWTIINIWLT